MRQKAKKKRIPLHKKIIAWARDSYRKWFDKPNIRDLWLMMQKGQDADVKRLPAKWERKLYDLSKLLETVQETRAFRQALKVKDLSYRNWYGLALLSPHPVAYVQFWDIVVHAYLVFNYDRQDMEDDEKLAVIGALLVIPAWPREFVCSALGADPTCDFSDLELEQLVAIAYGEEVE